MEPDSRHLISVVQLVGRMALHSLYFFLRINYLLSLDHIHTNKEWAYG